MDPAKTEQQNSTTSALVTRSLEGDLTAFRLLLESHEEYAFALAFRLLHDEEKAKDVVQDAFIRIWNHLARYSPEVKFTTWMYKIVVNLCYDTMKSDSRRNNVFGFLPGWLGRNDIADRRDLQAEIEKRDLCDWILAAAKKLPPMENLVFHLRDVQDFSIEEVAEIAGISAGSVKANLCYARKRLRTAVMQLEEREEP